jgi:hypothetical protein
MLPQHPVVEEDLTMSDHTPAPGDPDGESGVLDESSEAAMMRAVMRTQEKHREGGVDPDLGDADVDSAPDA